MFTIGFLRAAAERAVKTAAQAALALLAGTATGVLGVDWQQIGSVSALAAIVSFLTSFASAALTDGAPSLGGETIVPRRDGAA